MDIKDIKEQIKSVKPVILDAPSRPPSFSISTTEMLFKIWFLIPCSAVVLCRIQHISYHELDADVFWAGTFL